MGYELETSPISDALAGTWIDRRLAARWQRADERLVSAMRGYAAVRRTSTPGDAAWIEAQLRLAEARLRRRECADEVERLAEITDEPELMP